MAGVAATGALQSLAEQMHGDRVGDLAARCDRFALVIQVADPRLHAVLHDAGWNLEHGPEHQRAVRALADRGEILWKVRDWVTVPVGEIGTVDRGDVEADRVAERDKVPGPGEVVDFFTDGRVAEPIRLAIAGSRPAPGRTSWAGCRRRATRPSRARSRRPRYWHPE